MPETTYRHRDKMGVLYDAHYAYNSTQLSSGNRAAQRSDTGAAITVLIPVRVDKARNPENKMALCDFGTDKDMNMFYGWSTTSACWASQYIPGGGRSSNGMVHPANGGNVLGSAPFQDDFLNGRHMAGLNVLFVDGHASPMTGKDVGDAFYTNNGNSNLFTGLFALWSK